MIARGDKSLEPEETKRPLALIFRCQTICRVSRSKHGPTKVQPFKVNLVPGGRPRKTKMRRYAPKHAMFTHESLNQNLGYVQCNPWSPWSSTVLIVSRPWKVDEFRVTVDTRYPNTQNIPVASPMPILKMIMQHM